jgi:uncharacterized protein
MAAPEYDIADWRRRVSALYAEVRAVPPSKDAHEAWCAGRESLFRHHPQSPLVDDPARTGWSFRTYPYDPALRFATALETVQNGDGFAVAVGEDGTLQLRPFARTKGLSEPLGGELTLYWIEGYGGGIFLPFADATSGNETYGGGRYLLDTIKGADLGGSDGTLVVDFNFAYQPSCSYSPRWTCPLAPPENRLGVAVRAGERVD